MQDRKLNPQREKWLDEYCTHGDPGLAAKNAGYSGRSDAELRREGMRLKKILDNLITTEMESRMGDKGPKALRVVEDLMRDSNSDTVRLAAAKDLLDRSGYKPVERIDVTNEQRPIEEIEARIVGLVGVDAAHLLLGKHKPEKKEDAIPVPEETESVSQTIN